MKLVITDTIFNESSELVLGVVILHDIDNSQNQSEITELLRQAEAALPGKFDNTPVIEHPYIAIWREACRFSFRRERNTCSTCRGNHI